MSDQILVVDDDRHVRDVLSTYLGDEGYAVSCAQDAQSALSSLRRFKPDLVVLDIRLPDRSGLDALKAMRDDGCTAPVIMLTACAQEIDKIVGLELGADDYITKPFSSREVLARIRSVLRRSKCLEAGLRPVRIGSIELDIEGHEVKVGDEKVPLTRTEFRILELMARHPGRTFERAQLLDAIEADPDVMDRTLDKHIMNLRRKLGHFGAGADVIATVQGVGYKVVDPTRNAAPAQL